MQADDSFNQIAIPPSFVALYVPSGRIKPTESRQTIAARYEFCEDLAQMLTETALNQLHGLHITETDVLERVSRGLTSPGAETTAAEAQWIITRLAELLNWPPLGSAPSD